MGTFQTGFTFVKGVLTNGAALPGNDYISSLIFYTNTPPTGFPSNGIKECFSIQDAINSGVVNTHVGETKAIGKLAIGTAGATGDIINIYFQEPINPTNTNPSPNQVLLGTYTVASTDTTATLQAAAIAAVINSNTYITGYTAISSTTTVLITVRAGLGVYPNSGTVFSTVYTPIGSSTFVGTWTQPTGSGGTTQGVASFIDIIYYHVSEFFRMNPQGVLWLGIFAVPGTFNFSEVTTIQNNASGQIRQVGIYTPTRTVVSNSAADIVALNTVCQTLDNTKMPLSAVISQDMHSVTDLTTLPNNSGLNCPWVSTVISQDGNAQGFALYKAYGSTIGNIGAILGVISTVQVSADIAQPISGNNISNQSENQVPALGNGTLISTVTTGQQTQFDNYRYIYTNNYVGYTGTYFNDSHCCIVQNSNYAWIEQNRVEAKIERLMYQAYLPYLKSQLQLNADGTLYNPLVSSLESVGNEALAVMVRAGELSGVETVINPNQNITVSGKLVVTLYEQNNPIARNIEVDINSVTVLP